MPIVCIVCPSPPSRDEVEIETNFTGNPCERGLSEEHRDVWPIGLIQHPWVPIFFIKRKKFSHICKSVLLLNNFVPPVFLFDIDEGEIESNWSRNKVYKTYMQAASPPLWSAHQVIFEFFFSFQKSKTSHFLFDLLIRFTAKTNLFTHWLHLPCPSFLTRSCSRQKWQNCPLAENHSKFLPKCSFFFTCRGKSNLLLNPNQ